MYSIEHINNEIKIKPQDITLFLAKPDKTKIAKLKHVSGKLLTIKSQETNQLSFNVPYWVDIDHKLVKNPHIDKFKEKYLIEANFNNKTEWFVINSIVKTSEESDDLQISCMSLEYLLNYRYMVEYENTGNCLMLTNDTLKGTGFKVGYINPKFNLMYRRLEITRQTKLATIYQIAETFGAIVRFDTVNMTVNFYTEDEVYQYKGFSIGYGKYIQNIEEKIDPDEIVTRLYVFGSDGMSINGVNPTGQSYIDDFSYFLYPFEMDDEGNVIQSSEYMSDDLAKALVLYNKYVSERKGLFSNYLNEKRELQIQKTEKENQLSDLELELQIILDAIVVAKADNQPTKELTKQRDNLNKEINKIKNEIKGIDKEINRIDENIEKLREDLRYENHLTEEQLKELQNFIHEAEFTDENLFDETELYEAGLQEIKKVNTPPITINTSLVNFFKIISERHNWDRFDIDDIIRINHERLGTDIKIKLNEFQIDFDNNDIDVVATNNDFIDNVNDKISRLFYTIDKVDTEQRKRKINWEKVAYNFNLRNDRIEDKPTNPTNAIITHKENDDGSVNLILKWDYPDFNKTGKNADNIDGFTIFLHADEDNEPYQFGSRMGEEVIVSEIPYTSRSYVFPSVPANLYYTVGIKAYRRVDEDISLDGILFSDLIVFKSDGNVKSNQVQTFSLMSTVTQKEDNDENDFKLIDPYQPSPEVNIKALINGARIIPSLSEPNNPKINDIWIDLTDKKVKVWDGSAWSGDIKIEQIEKELKNHEEYMKEFEEHLNEELEKAQKELEEAMQQVEEEMRRIEEEVLPEIERAVDEAYIPHSEFPPEKVPTSGLWMDTSQSPSRLMRWDGKLADYVPLAPTEQEIQELMEKMREEAKTESIRYSKLDILKVRKTLTDRIDKEVEKVLEDIQRLENIKNDLINRVNDVESYVDHLRDIVGDDIEEIQKIANDMRELADEINDLVSDVQNRLGDFEGRIVTIENEVDEINGKISSTIEAIERVDGIVSQHQSTLEQHSDMIAAKVDSITYQEDKAGIISEIEKNTTAIELLNGQIQLKADQSVVDNINQEITNINTELSLQAGKIESKVDRTEYNELENTVSQNTTRIEQTEMAIQQTISRIESAEGRLDKAESDIRQNAEAIELRATKQEVELIEGNIASISEEISSLTIAYNNITSEVSRIEQDLDGKIQSNTTLIQQTAEGINARIDSFEYEYNQDKTDILTSIERNESAISALADSIELMVTKEEYRTDMEGIDEFISSTNATLQLHANALEAKAERSELVNYVDKQTYTNQIGELNVAIDGISGRVEKTEADINKITGDVNSLSTQVASLDITVNGITATVESLEADMQSAQQSISQIQQTADSITQTVSRLETNIDGLEDELTAVHSTIEQLPDQINLAVSEGIANIEIGGRNLIRNSEEISWSSQTNNYSYQIIYRGLEKNQTYTFSFEAELTGSGNTDYITVYPYLASGQSMSQIHVKYESNKRMSVTFTTDERYNYNLLVYAGRAGSTAGNNITLRYFKLEKGNKATDWTPAPEDQVNKTNILSSINLSTEGVKIQGNKIDLVGLVTALNADGTPGTMIHGNKIVTGSITANQLNVNNIFSNSAVIGQIQSNAIATASLSANQITTGTLDVGKVKLINLVGLDIYGSRFRSETGTDFMEIIGGNIRLQQANGQFVEIRPSGFYGYNSANDISFQADSNYVTSAKFGTNNLNVYLGASLGGEIRTVVYETSFGKGGDAREYDYVDIRTLGIKAAPNQHVYLMTDHEIRATSYDKSTYRDIRGNVIYGAGFTTTTTNAYIGTDNVLHVVNKGYVQGSAGNPIYRDIRANDIYNRAIITSTTHAYIGTDNELRVVNKGLTDIYRNVRAAYYYGTVFEFNSVLGGSHIYIRPTSSGEVRITQQGSTSNYRPVRASAFNEASSRDYKTNIEEYTDSALEVINDLTVVTYNLKDDLANGIIDKKIGFISEDSPAIATADGKAIQTYQLSAYNTKAIQELDSKFTNLEDEINWLKLENQYLKQKVKQLEEMIT